MRQQPIHVRNGLVRRAPQRLDQTASDAHINPIGDCLGVLPTMPQ